MVEEEVQLEAAEPALPILKDFCLCDFDRLEARVGGGGAEGVDEVMDKVLFMALLKSPRPWPFWKGEEREFMNRKEIANCGSRSRSAIGGLK